MRGGPFIVSIALLALPAAADSPPSPPQPTKALVGTAAATAQPEPPTVEHRTPTGAKEMCQLLAPFPFVPPDVTQDPASQTWYRDDDFQGVKELCAIDLYAPKSTDSVTAVGVCPKLHWSQPALELYELADADSDKAKFEKQRCPRWRKARRAHKIAKIKPPIYGTEVESPLLYFHLSKLLGNLGHVYPTTWRQVSRATIHEQSVLAAAYLEVVTHDRTTHDGWQVANHRYRPGGRSPGVVGAMLAKNPRGEDSHHPFKYYPDRTRRIGSPKDVRAQAYWKVVSSREPIEELIAFDASRPKKYREAVQALAYAQDITHMVILDAVLNQRDRAGNIHSRRLYHTVDAQGRLRWRKERPNGAAGKKAVRLERLLLKDNDDGLNWKAVGRLNSSLLIGEIRHLDPTTYARVQWLAGLMRDPATAGGVKSYFTSAHITSATYDHVRDRFLAIAADFEKLHTAGKLRLDLGLAKAVAEAPELERDKDRDKDDARHR